ncbi:MAG: hypothetical protein P8X63_13020 [Desulfuromonadaceae bacterium]
MNKPIFCSYCLGAVAPSADRCPHCAAELSKIYCPPCKFAGEEKDFDRDRCPRCGAMRLLAISADDKRATWS